MNNRRSASKAALGFYCGSLATLGGFGQKFLNHGLFNKVTYCLHAQGSPHWGCFNCANLASISQCNKSSLGTAQQGT